MTLPIPPGWGRLAANRVLAAVVNVSPTNPRYFETSGGKAPETVSGERTSAVEGTVRPREWRPKARLCGFNLLGMFCKTKMAAGDNRIVGYFPEDRFRWIRDWGFNFARLPLDYRFFVKDGDWMTLDEAQLRKLDAAVDCGRKYGVHVNIDFHRAPGYCINPPDEPKQLFTDPEPKAAFTNLWAALARRYRAFPTTS